MAGLDPAIPLRCAGTQSAARGPRLLRLPGMTPARQPGSLHMISITRQWIDNRDLLHREVRHDLNVVLLHDQHFLDANAVTESLPVLGLESEGHALLDFDRMIERPYPRNDRRIVLRQAKAVAP